MGKTVEAVKKSLEILLHIVNSSIPLGVSDIAKDMEMSVSNVFKHLKTLKEYGLILQNEEKRYLPGYRLIDLGSIALKRFNLREVAHPNLVKLMLQTDQTVHLVIKEGNEGVYIEKLESARSLPMLSRLGMRMPLFSTGFGKAILAFMPDSEVSKYLDSVTFTKRTEHTITDRQRFYEELKKTRDRKYSIDDEENEVGIRCVGSAILNRSGYPIAGVSITGAARLITHEWIHLNARHVVQCAESVSIHLGWDPNKK